MFDNEEYVIGTDDSWKIDSDKLAEWALKKIKAEEEDIERLKKLAEEEKAAIDCKVKTATASMENSTAFLRSKLAEYFDTVQHKETKTMESYKLLTGTLVRKKSSIAIDYDPKDKEMSAALLAFLKGSDNEEFIKVEETPKWGEYKKVLSIVDGDVIDTITGEVVPLFTKETPAEFSIKF